MFAGDDALTCRARLGIEDRRSGAVMRVSAPGAIALTVTRSGRFLRRDHAERGDARLGRAVVGLADVAVDAGADVVLMMRASLSRPP